MHGPESETLRAEFEAWRSASALNASEYATLERTWDLAAGLGATELGRARSLPRKPQPFAWATAPRIGLALAATIAAVLLFTLWPSTTGVLQPISVAHATSVGEIRTFQLPDGSSVTVDTDSRIAVTFDSKVRKVTLERGRARFDVRPDPARAFLVEAGGTIFSAKDSRFDISLEPQGVCASTLRGLVEARPAGNGGAAPVRLVAGKMVRLTPQGAPLGPSMQAGKGSERWVSGMLVYQGAPLSAVLAETNRYSTRRIVLGDPALGTLRVTGTFRPVPVDELANALAAAFNLQIRPSPDGQLVLSRR